MAVTAALVLFAGLAIDAQRPPHRQLGARAALVAIDVYQATLSRVFARAGMVCRFEPTCSHYGYAAIEHHGLVRGTWLSVRRVSRCGPWTEAGTFDPLERVAPSGEDAQASPKRPGEGPASAEPPESSF